MIRALVVDDSPVVRSALERGLSRDGDILVARTASDPYDAVSIMQRESFDVIILDAEMPRMDGLTFLRKLRERRQIPVVMCSSLARRSPEFVLASLREGASQVVPKPHNGYSIQRMLGDLRTAIRSAAAAGAAPVRTLAAAASKPQSATSNQGARQSVATSKLIAVGASTGGIQAFEQVLGGIPPTGPGIVVAQHLPESFVARYATRLNNEFPQTVCVAQDDVVVRRGTVHIAPASHHLEVRMVGSELRTRLVNRGPVNHHRPSVDVLFNSVAKARPRSAVAVLLTGMGRDGAQGLLCLKSAGASTICQDEASSAVFGMPRAAIELGAAQETVALKHIAGRIAARLK